MSVLAWIVLGGVLMALVALVGSVTLILPEATMKRVLLPLVALAAGTLLGGAFFHMIPEAVDALGNGAAVYAWIVGGFVTFFALEQFLHWHHCHRGVSEHQPVGHLVLVADGLHNFLGGVAVGGSFLVDVRVGIVAWLVAAAHEVPQEFGDFGLLVHSGWSHAKALMFNVLSASTFLVGGLVAYALSGAVDVAIFVPFAAGNFLYIAMADLIPQFTAHEEWGVKVRHTGAFVVGLAAMYAAAVGLG